ncbi:hypothetical protein [Acinetobacter ursingii]|uniref:hypothetical protein n=1 Tax=Acinetobacter ursingii TaxID=108980 RepID=UPI001D1971FB|nr:hypothetical protein [Acinetobacter ursingii]
MSTKFPTLQQALDNDKAEQERFSSLKTNTFQALRSIPETWIFTLFDKNDSEKFHEYIEVISVIFLENISKVDDMPALEFIKNNISEILYQCKKIEKDLEDEYNGIEGKKGGSFENFKVELRSPTNLFNDNLIDFKAKVNENLELFKARLEMLYNSSLSFKKIKESFDDYLKIYINKSVGAVDKELESFRRLRNIADNAKTEDIYHNAVNKFRNLEKNYRNSFYIALGVLVMISLLTMYFKVNIIKNFELNNYEFWILKAALLVAGITLISYFLKQSSHYQRLADQNYQTQVELQAYPSFMESIPTEEAASVRKELALKYFGREIDGAAHKDMSNLISDQMKSTTDMVKATTEAIKNLKG